MIRLLLADDHTIVREGLKKIIALTDDIKVAGEAANGAEVMQCLRHTADYDMVLLDYTMPGINGMQLIQSVRSNYPALPVLVFTMHNETQIAYRALKEGVSGFIVKDCEPEILMRAIRKVAVGGRYTDPAIAERLAFDSISMGQGNPHTLLSNREFEVFRMLVGGKRINEIAEQLSISNKTVSTHKQHLMDKMKIDNLADLVRYAATYNLFR